MRLSRATPAEVRRFRFEKEVIARLQALQWWDWPAEQITKAQDALISGDNEALERIGLG